MSITNSEPESEFMIRVEENGLTVEDQELVDDVLFSIYYLVFTIYSQKSASIQPRTRLSKFLGDSDGPLEIW